MVAARDPLRRMRQRTDDRRISSEQLPLSALQRAVQSALLEPLPILFWNARAVGQRRLDMQRSKQESRDRRANERPDNRNPGVAPVRTALPGDRQHGVRDSRSEVARRINRVAGGGAERKADAPYDHADQVWSKSRREAVRGHCFRDHGAYGEDEHKCSDDFTQQIPRKRSNRRTGAENRKLGDRIVRNFPVRPVMEENQHRTNERTSELRGQIRRELRIVAEINREAE